MRLSTRDIIIVIGVLALSLTPVTLQTRVQPQEDPIDHVGHGALFDKDGQQLTPTAELVARAQAFYRSQLLPRLSTEQRARFNRLERAVAADKSVDAQDRLIVDNELLRWMLNNVQDRSGLVGIGTKINALRQDLEWSLPVGAQPAAAPDQKKTRFTPGAATQKLLQSIAAADQASKVLLMVTASSGQAYINECAAAGVPIPPPIGRLDPAGTAGWRSIGFIPPADQFIVGTPAEVRVFQSASPEGVCFALPRYSDNTLTTVSLDGVLCLGRATSKMCMWDNQMNGAGFSFPSGTEIPIGVPDLAINPAGLYQAGGAELEFGSGGVCTNCHAGQNPYIIHPLTNLGPNNTAPAFGALGAAPFNLPMFAVSRYDPLAAVSWPQNDRSMSPALVPSVCKACHVAGGTGGALPHISSELGSYCTDVLNKAIARTMPPGAGGSQASNPDVIALAAWCGQPRSAGPSDRGDPHVATTNDVSYDFQAAGEFTVLRNSDSRFELQTRQTPVSTTFTPGANAHTGLASCVSLNTAVALRLGKHRVTYQPPSGPNTKEKAGRHELRVDGGRVTVPRRGLRFADGSRITVADANGALDVRAVDGTRVIITPNFWSSQGYWYLDVDVLDSPAREGIMGAILAPNWLPLAPDGSALGPAPAALPDRHTLLNQKFASAWRVTPTTSLFDYAAGTSTKNFTDPNWPPVPGKPCVGSPLSQNKPLEPMNADVARKICSVIKPKAVRDNCVFDAIAMNNPDVPQAYLRALQLRAAAVVP